MTGSRQEVPGATELWEVRLGPDGSPEDADHSGQVRPRPRAISGGVLLASGEPSYPQAGVGPRAAAGCAADAGENGGLSGPPGRVRAGTACWTASAPGPP